MGRAPCCEKTGLKKGPWTRDEDQLLTNYIKENGHGNWRALPKKAGLLRCGKSCRLRWTNYLRPDIKRGNFTKEEGDTIIDLHKELGNKWSAIAAKLPGRTDNEIKNVWHTHLKKRLNPTLPPAKRVRKRSKLNPSSKSKKREDGDGDGGGDEARELKAETRMQVDQTSPNGQEDDVEEPNSPSQTSSSSDNSSVITTATTINGGNSSTLDAVEKFLGVEEDFWSDVISGTEDLPAVNSCGGDAGFHIVQSEIDTYDFDPKLDDMEFWYDIFTRDGGDMQGLLLLPL